MRKLLKESVSLLLGEGIGLRLIQSVRPVSALIVAYHNVIDSDAVPRGDRSLHLPLDRFLEQITWLQDHFEIVSLQEILRRQSQAHNLAAITFDDAYVGAVSNALPFLIERGLPATLFVCSDWDTGTLPWWDALAGPAGLSEGLREAVLNSCSGRGRLARSWANSQGVAWSDLPSEYRVADESKLKEILSESQFTVGMHTHSHSNLTTLAEHELEEELRLCLRETSAKYHNSISVLAYPYGLWNRRVAEAVERIGFKAALRISGGPIRNWDRIDRFAIPRVNVPSGISLPGFKLRCLGIS